MQILATNGNCIGSHWAAFQIFPQLSSADDDDGGGVDDGGDDSGGDDDDGGGDGGGGDDDGGGGEPLHCLVWISEIPLRKKKMMDRHRGIEFSIKVLKLPKRVKLVLDSLSHWNFADGDDLRLFSLLGWEKQHQFVGDSTFKEQI